MALAALIVAVAALVIALCHGHVVTWRPWRRWR